MPTDRSSGCFWPLASAMNRRPSGRVPVALGWSEVVNAIRELSGDQLKLWPRSKTTRRATARGSAPFSGTTIKSLMDC